MPPRGVTPGTKRARQRTKGRTRDQLYAEARAKRIEGRSKMSKAQLQRAVDAKR